MIYGINDIPRTIKEWILYAIQQVLSIFVATVLIANICGTPVDSCLLGACIGTLIYQVITGFKSPIFISSCGATCSAVIGALAITNNENYLPVVIGGAIILIIYALFALIVKCKGIESINKIFPPTIVGAVTIVIGLNLATYIPTYVQINGEYNTYGIAVALLTTLVIAITSHYFKGFLKTIPFLIGLIFGYVLSVILTLTNVAPLIDFSIFKNITSIVSIPDFTFMHWSTDGITWATVGKVAILFTPVAVCALLEHYSDHKVLSNIIGTDLTVTPGLHRTLLGDGAASFIGTVLCGLPNTSYGESIATVGFSRVASTYVITLSSLILGALAFITPIQAAISSIPSCVFGGCAIILYGYIASSGLRTIINSNIDLTKNKNLIIISSILTIGVSGMWFLSQSFSGVALAMVCGVILNLVLKNES